VDTRDRRDLAAAITRACESYQQRSGLRCSTAFPGGLREVDPARIDALCEALVLALDEVTRRWAAPGAHVEVAPLGDPPALRLTVTGEPGALPGPGDDCVLQLRRCLRRWDGSADLTLLPLGLLSIRAWMPMPR
jgi:hypothetical protein